ncbi:MAG: hypothetical protein KF878_23340 [Planctomycetes bacterium]|nr:hypothetical protein [Planctomycetota bacterium]
MRRVAPETGREALRVAHPLQVEAVVLEALSRARAGDAPTPDLAGWVAARPLARLVDPVARFLDDPGARGRARRPARPARAQPEARAAVRVAAAEVARAWPRATTTRWPRRPASCVTWAGGRSSSRCSTA